MGSDPLEPGTLLVAAPSEDADPIFGRVVQSLEDGPGGRAGGLDPPMNRRATRSGRGA